MNRKIVISIITTFMLSVSAVSGFAAVQVDIADKVGWDAETQMYVPYLYSHYWLFEMYTPADEKVTGGLFLYFFHPARVEFFLSGSEGSDPEVRLTRFSIEQIPGLTFPYEIIDYGYLPSGDETDPVLFYNFSTEEEGFGWSFFDWQMCATKPMPQDSVSPGAVYYGLLEGSGEIDEAVLKDLHLMGSVKAQGIESVTFTGPNAIIPELPQGVLPVIIVFLCAGLPYLIASRRSR